MNDKRLKQDIALDELFEVLFARKGTILLGTLFFAILSITIALYLPNQFKSNTTLIINSESSGGLASLAGNLGGLGGLAGMAGIDLGSSADSNNPLIARELITSQAFILTFIEKHNMLVPLMAAKAWDESTGKLLIDEDIYDVETSSWLVNNPFSKISRPRKEDIVKKFKEILVFSEESKSRFILKVRL